MGNSGNSRNNPRDTNQQNDNKIKLKHIKEIIELLSLIATVLSAVVCILTLNEMQIERNKAYEPHIVLSPMLLSVDTEETEIYGEDVSEGGFTSTYGHVESKMDICHTSISTFQQDFTNYIFEIPAFNIGDGTCYDLTCTYSYESHLELLNFCESYNGFSTKIPPTGFTKDEYEEYHKIHIPFVLSQAEETSAFDLPSTYMWFLSELQHNDIYRDDLFILNEFPQILMDIEYKDIQGREFKQSIKLDVEFYSCRPIFNEKINDETLVLNYLITPTTLSKKNK